MNRLATGRKLLELFSAILAWALFASAKSEAEFVFFGIVALAVTVYVFRPPKEWLRARRDRDGG